jgi:8-oxo-dGTP pyrophosphatase MutT (NUDIX family)
MNDLAAVRRIARLDLHFRPQAWAFADARRVAIDAHFAAMQQANPSLWNGRVLMLYRYTLADGVFSGDYLETDYAGFTAWHRWGMPQAGVYDCFAAAAIQAADDAFLLGVMGPHTFNAGMIYCPCGTPDPVDIIGDRVDLEASVRREFTEETGLDPADFAIEPGWTTVLLGPHIVHNKILRSRDDAETLRARILSNLAQQDPPELADIRIVRRPADLDPAMPDFVRAFLEYRWSGG